MNKYNTCMNFCTAQNVFLHTDRRKCFHCFFYSEVYNSELLTRPGHGLKPFIFALKQTHQVRYAYFKLFSTKTQHLTGTFSYIPNQITKFISFRHCKRPLQSRFHDELIQRQNTIRNRSSTERILGLSMVAIKTVKF